jgi:hypothetical protein
MILTMAFLFLERGHGIFRRFRIPKRLSPADVPAQPMKVVSTLRTRAASAGRRQASANALKACQRI